MSDTRSSETESPRGLSAGGALAGLLVALFVIGLVGWLVQGAGYDESVPTVPFTTAHPATVPVPPPSLTP